MKLIDLIEAPEGEELSDDKFPKEINGWKLVDDIPEKLWDFLAKRQSSEWYIPAYKKSIEGVDHYIVTTNNGHYYKTDGQSIFVGMYAMKSASKEDRPTQSSSYMLPQRGQPSFTGRGAPQFGEFNGTSVITGIALISSDDELQQIKSLAMRK